MIDSPMLWILRWFIFSDVRMSHAEVCALTGIPDATLQNWANRGLLPEMESAQGKGTRRTYEPSVLANVYFAVWLNALGVEARAAARAGFQMYYGLLAWAQSRHEKDLLNSGPFVSNAFKENDALAMIETIATVHVFRQAQSDPRVQVYENGLDEDIQREFAGDRPMIVYPIGRHIQNLAWSAYRLLHQERRVPSRIAKEDKLVPQKAEEQINKRAGAGQARLRSKRRRKK
jgi:hypothetical protein